MASGVSKMNKKIEGLEMKGGGYYSANTKGAAEGIMKAWPWAQQAVSEITSSLPDAHFVVGDFGAADGGTSQGILC